jgi:hypothetical protein
MQTETHPAPAAKQPEGREYYAVDFDLREFRQIHSEIRRSTISDRLGLSSQSLDNYDRKRCPLSVYKAIIEAFAPDDAPNYELKLLVSKIARPFHITKEALTLARAYDRRRAGAKLTLADGSGYYQIAPEQKNNEIEVKPDNLPAAFDIEVPLSAEAQLVDEPGATPIQHASPEQAILLQQQEALIAILARVTTERDEGAIEIQRQKHLLADRDATIANMGGQIARLKDSVRTWEELSKQEPLHGTPATQDVTLLAEAIINRLRGTLTASGHPTLVKELERLSPKKMGYSSFPQANGRNGNSRNFR